MTLILTEASELGIAMAADSALTFPDRVFLGIQKLIPIRAQNAGLSMWGIGKIGQLYTDDWMQKLIEGKIKDKMTLWETAETIAGELNAANRKPLDFYSGMHIAGYDFDDHGEKLPAIYHIHNGHHSYRIQNGKIEIVPSEKPRDFRAHKDFPPQHLPSGKAFLLRNGDIMVYSALSQIFDQVFEQLAAKVNLIFPYPNTLEARGEHLRFWINLISHIYRRSNYYHSNVETPPTIGGSSIGGPISVLTIDETGIRSFYAS